MSDESRNIINSAVNDVLSITSGREFGDTAAHHVHHVHHTTEVQHHHHAYPYPVPVVRHVHHVVPGPVRTVEKRVAVPYAVPIMPPPQPSNPPHSSVMRAIADANEQSAADTVDE